VGEVPEVELSGRGLLRSSVPFITCWREEERFRRRTLAGLCLGTCTEGRAAKAVITIKVGEP
jgi:hypothetical protein